MTAKGKLEEISELLKQKGIKKFRQNTQDIENGKEDVADRKTKEH